MLTPPDYFNMYLLFIMSHYKSALECLTTGVRQDVQVVSLWELVMFIWPVTHQKPLHVALRSDMSLSDSFL